MLSLIHIYEIFFEPGAEAFALGEVGVEIKFGIADGDMEIALHASLGGADGGITTVTGGKSSDVISHLSVEVADAVGTGQPPEGAGSEDEGELLSLIHI